MTCTPESPRYRTRSAAGEDFAGPHRVAREVDYERLRFAYRVGTDAGTGSAEVFDASILSDEATAPGAPNFTGAFVGVACQDVSGAARPADFDSFEYREREYQVTSL